MASFPSSTFFDGSFKIVLLSIYAIAPKISTSIAKKEVPCPIFRRRFWGGVGAWQGDGDQKARGRAGLTLVAPLFGEIREKGGYAEPPHLMESGNEGDKLSPLIWRNRGLRGKTWAPLSDGIGE